MLKYRVGSNYTREDIYRIEHIPVSKRGGDWLNGYHRHHGDYFIFCNVGVAGRTGHDHGNRWKGKQLVWHGKTNSHFRQKSIVDLVSGNYRVLVFYREADRAPFTFAGVGIPEPDYSSGRPVQVTWSFVVGGISPPTIFTDEYPVDTEHWEGHGKKVTVNRYERDPAARGACIAIHGTRCKACGLDMRRTYGELAEGFIHVHHVVPLSSIRSGYKVDPENDLVPVCPNCHAMLHRRKPPLDVEQLKAILKAMSDA